MRLRSEVSSSKFYGPGARCSVSNTVRTKSISHFLHLEWSPLWRQDEINPTFTVYGTIIICVYDIIWNIEKVTGYKWTFNTCIFAISKHTVNSLFNASTSFCNSVVLYQIARIQNDLYHNFMQFITLQKLKTNFQTPPEVLLANIHVRKYQ